MMPFRRCCVQKLGLQAERAGQDASDYSTVFLPWGPTWTAGRVRKLMVIKDVLLNAPCTENFDIIVDCFSRISQLGADHHTPCDVINVVSVLIRMRLGACNPMACPIRVFRG